MSSDILAGLARSYLFEDLDQEDLAPLAAAVTTRHLARGESLWQLAAYNMQASLMRDVNLTPFSPASVPSSAMVIWAALYTAATLAVAVVLFQRRVL